MEYSGILAEVFRASREIRIYSAEAEMQRYLSAASAGVARPYFGMTLLNRFVPSAFQYAGFLLLLGALSALGSAGDHQFADLGSVLLLVMRAFAYIQNFQVAAHGIGEAVPYVTRLMVFRDRFERAKQSQVSDAAERAEIEPCRHQRNIRVRRRRTYHSE